MMQNNSGMTGKRKITILVLIIILLIVVWQIKGLFQESTPTITPAPKGNMSTAQKQISSSITNTPMSSTTTITANQPIEQPELQQTPVSMSSQLTEVQKKSDQEYIEQINQLQMLKIQREIAETNQAIANAKLATVTAEKGVSNILTSHPSSPSATPATTEILAPPAPEATQYSLISVSMQKNKWNAVLQFQEKMFDVRVGDILPLDGSIVRSINKNAVILEKDGQRRKISIVSFI